MNLQDDVKDMIIKYPDPILSVPCEPFDFEKPQDDPIEIAQVLLHVMNHFNGIGLAANQIGKHYSVFCMRGAPENFVCFNPRIVYSSDQMVTMEEGCLSVPNVIVKVKRPAEIRVRFQTPSGQIVTKSFSGLTARTFQHELDHLNGTMFFNRANRYHREKAMKGYYK